MTFFRFLRIALIAVILLPLLFVQAQEPGKKEARAILQPLNDKLDTRKPVNDVIDSLKILEAVADELHGKMHSKLGDLMLHPDPIVRKRAAITIASIGVNDESAPMVIDSLSRRLNDADPEVRAVVLFSLKRLGHYSRVAVPKAIEAFKHADPRVRRAAIELVGIHLETNKDLMPIVISALDDPDSGPNNSAPGLNSVSYAAMTYLANYKSEAKAAEPKLVRIVNSKKEDDADRWMALGTLAAVAPENPLPLRTAREWLKNKDRPADLIKASILVSKMGVHAKNAVPDLIAVAKMKPFPDRETDLSVKRAVLQAFRRIGPAAREALPTLQEFLRNDDAALRIHVLQAIDAVKDKE